MKEIIYFISRSKLQIIDDDFDSKSLLPDTLGNRLDDDIEVAEDAPVIAEFIDERPELIQQMESYRTTKRWKTLGGMPFSLQ